MILTKFKKIRRKNMNSTLKMIKIAVYFEIDFTSYTLNIFLLVQVKKNTLAIKKKIKY